MKYKHESSVGDLLSHNNVFGADDYLGIKFILMTKKFENHIGLYMRVKLPFGFDTVFTRIRFGLINKNGNLCKVYNAERTWKYGDNSAFGNDTYLPLDKIEHYKSDNKMRFTYEIVECRYENNYKKMIMTIYQHICKEEGEKNYNQLKDTVDELYKENDELKSKNELYSSNMGNIKMAANKYKEEWKDIKEELDLKNAQIISLVNQIEILKEELEEAKMDVTVGDHESNMIDYINIVQGEDEPEEEERNNVYKHFDKSKYVMNLMDVDKINLSDYNSFDLRAFQSKFSKLQSRISQKLLDLQTCNICYVEEIDSVYIPCGHKCSCSLCSSKLKSCPICRKQIKNVVKIYHS